MSSEQTSRRDRERRPDRSRARTSGSGSQGRRSRSNSDGRRINPGSHPTSPGGHRGQPATTATTVNPASSELNPHANEFVPQFPRSNPYDTTGHPMSHDAEIYETQTSWYGNKPGYEHGATGTGYGHGAHPSESGAYSQMYGHQSDSEGGYGDGAIGTAPRLYVHGVGSGTSGDPSSASAALMSGVEIPPKTGAIRKNPDRTTNPATTKGKPPPDREGQRSVLTHVLEQFKTHERTTSDNEGAPNRGPFFREEEVITRDRGPSYNKNGEKGGFLLKQGFYYVLNINWPPGMCPTPGVETTQKNHFKCTKRIPEEWHIHALYLNKLDEKTIHMLKRCLPLNDYKDDFECKVGDKKTRFKSMNDGSTDKEWRAFVYEKHGTCYTKYTNLKTESDYFCTALELFETLQLADIFANTIPSTDQTYKISYFSELVRRKFKVRPFIHVWTPQKEGVKGADYYLFGLSFYFTKEENGYHLVDCAEFLEGYQMHDYVYSRIEGRYTNKIKYTYFCNFGVRKCIYLPSSAHNLPRSAHS